MKIKLIKKILLSILLIIFIIFLFCIIKINNYSWIIKNKIKIELDKAIGSNITFDQFKLHFFPKIYLNISNVKFDNFIFFSGTIKNLQIHPKILSILLGKVKISNLTCEELNIISKITNNYKEDNYFYFFKKYILSILKISKINFNVINGKLILLNNKNNVFLFTGINIKSNFIKNDFFLDLQVKSSPIGKFSIYSSLFYCKNILQIQKMSCYINHSYIYGINGFLKLDENNPFLLTHINNILINLNEIKNNLKKTNILDFLPPKKQFNYFNFIKGKIYLNSSNFSFSFNKHFKWSLSTTGKFKDLVLNSKLLHSQLIRFAKGNFKLAFNIANINNFLILKNIQAKIGQSYFENLTLFFEEKNKKKYFQFETNKCFLFFQDINIKQVSTLFKKYLEEKFFLKIKSLKGFILINKFLIYGPVFNYKNWVLFLKGNIKNISISSYYFNKILNINSGQVFFLKNFSKINFLFQNLNGNIGNSYFLNIKGKLFFLEKKRRVPFLQISIERLRMNFNEIHQLKYLFKKKLFFLEKILNGSIDLYNLRFSGKLNFPKSWIYYSTGKISNGMIYFPNYSQTLKINGNFFFNQNIFYSKKMKVNFLDSNLNLEIIINLLNNQYHKNILKISGIIHNKTINWLSNFFSFPPIIHFPSLIYIKDLLIDGCNKKNFWFKGTLIPNNGPLIKIYFLKYSKYKSYMKIDLQDQITNATIVFYPMQKSGTNFLFLGKIHQKSIESFLIKKFGANTILNGNIFGYISYEDFTKCQFLTGNLNIKNIFIPFIKEDFLLNIKNINLILKNNNFYIKSALLGYNEQTFQTNGILFFKKNHLTMNLQLATKCLVYEKLEKLIYTVENSYNQNKSSNLLTSFYNTIINGNINILSDKLIFKTYTADSLLVNIKLNPNLVKLNIINLIFYGLPFTGKINIFTDKMEMIFNSNVLNMNLSKIIKNFNGKNDLASGKFDINCYLQSFDFFDKNISGEFFINIYNGVFYKINLFKIFLNYLNLNSVFSTEENLNNLKVNNLSLKGFVNNSIIEVSELDLAGSIFNLIGQGTYDFVTNQIAFSTLLSPFSQLQHIFDYIPLIKIPFKNIFSIPIGIYGSLSKITIVPLDFAAIEYQFSSLIKILKNLFNI